ncbi:3-hydroxyisobutyrate dehydrogenase [Bradyrhizobium sp. AZCC 2262]|uniref:3-hydroxyisobutyrate dehydrogenase n=1 Tax=Bradyrhizobium sp. AZCC 2262 TaxID=3117022 RepID=UPI002FF0FA78
MTTVAFIGLGTTGPPMILNLLGASHKVIAFDASALAREHVRALGADVGSNAAAVADGADVVITLLPTGAQVERVWSEVSPVLDQNALLIDCSTISIESARRAHQTASRHGLRAVDAPAFGCHLNAQQGELTFFCGGDQSAFLSARPILGAMGKTVVHCGQPGAGQAAKTCNSMFLGTSMIAVSEVFSLGEKLGLSHRALFDIVSTLSKHPWFQYCPVPGLVPNSPANDDYKPGLTTSSMLNDLRLCQTAARQAGVFTPLGWHTENIYEEFEQAGHGATDFSAIIQHLRSLTRYIGI